MVSYIALLTVGRLLTSRLSSYTMKIRYDQLLVLSELFKIVSVRSPNRLEIINDYANAIFTAEQHSEYSNVLCNILIDMHDENLYEQTNFTLSHRNIERLENNE